MASGDWRVQDKLPKSPSFPSVLLGPYATPDGKRSRKEGPYAEEMSCRKAFSCCRCRCRFPRLSSSSFKKLFIVALRRTPATEFGWWLQGTRRRRGCSGGSSPAHRLRLFETDLYDAATITPSVVGCQFVFLIVTPYSK
ncbi:hypothetical protein ABZP36_034853 [Zizania latifolia]